MANGRLQLASPGPMMEVPDTRKYYSLKDLLAYEDDPNMWIIPGMVRKNSICIVFGDSSTYKSTIVFDLCVAIASDGHLFRQIEVKHHGPVLLVSTEGSLQDNKNRILAHMRAHGKLPIDVPLYFHQRPFVLDDPVEVAELHNAIKKFKPICVVLDPMDSFFSGDENSAKETKAVRKEIGRLRDEYEVAVIVIHHAGKKDTTSPRGSSAIRAWADTVLHVTKRKDASIVKGKTIEIVTVRGDKQREGITGHVFSAVPLIDQELKQIYFMYYNGTDTRGIIREYFKSMVYERLLVGLPMTERQLRDFFGVGQETITEALRNLAEDELAANDVEVDRAFGPEGSRTRTVPAWRALRRQNIVDAAQLLVKTENEGPEEFFVDAVLPSEFGPEELAIVEQANSNSLRDARVQTG